MKQRIYLDTSVFGALTDPAPDYRIASTRTLFQRIRAGQMDGIVSNIFYEELERAPAEIRSVLEAHAKRLFLVHETLESLSHAQTYLRHGAFSDKHFNDARHIAVTVTNNIPIIASWNFRHMVNLARKRKVNSINLMEGYPAIEIVSPQEVEYGTEEEG